MRIELEEQGIKIHGHMLGSFNGWAEIDEDTGHVEKLVIYDGSGDGVNLFESDDWSSVHLRILLASSIRSSEQVRNIVHERQQSLAHDRIVARSGDRAYNAEL